MYAQVVKLTPDWGGLIPIATLAALFIFILL
jgi:hypothetical protein